MIFREEVRGGKTVYFIDLEEEDCERLYDPASKVYRNAGVLVAGKLSREVWDWLNENCQNRSLVCIEDALIPAIRFDQLVDAVHFKLRFA